MKVWVESLLLLSLTAISAQASGVEFWTCDFENGMPAGAVVTAGIGNVAVQSSSLSAYSGSKGLNIQGPSGSNGDTLVLPISTVGYRDVELRYWYKIREGLEATDHLYSGWTADGNEVLALADYSGVSAGDWQLAVFTLNSAADDNPLVASVWLATLANSSDRVNVDKVTAYGTPIPEPVTFCGLVLGLFFLAWRRP
jgi:hypothetical protein